MMKTYPLEAYSCGEDTYQVISRGHHDPHEFMRAVRQAGYDWPLGMPTHCWFRVVPDQSGDYPRGLYVEAKPHSRGAFPVTLTMEAFGEDGYEAKMANGAVQGRREGA